MNSLFRITLLISIYFTFFTYNSLLISAPQSMMQDPKSDNVDWVEATYAPNFPWAPVPDDSSMGKYWRENMLDAYPSIDDGPVNTWTTEYNLGASAWLFELGDSVLGKLNKKALFDKNYQSIDQNWTESCGTAATVNWLGLYLSGFPNKYSLMSPIMISAGMGNFVMDDGTKVDPCDKYDVAKVTEIEDHPGDYNFGISWYNTVDSLKIGVMPVHIIPNMKILVEDNDTMREIWKDFCWHMFPYDSDVDQINNRFYSWGNLYNSKVSDSQSQWYKEYLNVMKAGKYQEISIKMDKFAATSKNKPQRDTSKIEWFKPEMLDDNGNWKRTSYFWRDLLDTGRPLCFQGSTCYSRFGSVNTGSEDEVEPRGRFFEAMKVDESGTCYVDSNVPMADITASLCRKPTLQEYLGEVTGGTTVDGKAWYRSGGPDGGHNMLAVGYGVATANSPGDTPELLFIVLTNHNGCYYDNRGIVFYTSDLVDGAIGYTGDKSDPLLSASAKGSYNYQWSNTPIDENLLNF